MWLYFNSKGQLITSLEHGSPARVGSTNFEIFAAIEGLNETNIADYMATIKFFKPDLTNSSYPTLLMSNASALFVAESGEGDTGSFESGETYYGFVLKFNEIVDNNSTPLDDTDDNMIVLLDTDGLWKAAINVISDIHGYNVQGMATFNVAGNGTEVPSNVSYDVITNQLVQNINRRALKEQTIINIANTSVDISAYENGQMFYSVEDRKLYRKENGELVSQVDSSFTVDGSLSSTSENPVQNKVITNELQNVREVAEGKCDTFILSYADTISSIKSDVQAHPLYTKVFDQNGRDITQQVLNGDYDNFDVNDPDEGVIFCNPLFNSSDRTLNISGMYYNFIFREYVTDNSGTILNYVLYRLDYDDTPRWKVGDIFYVIETIVPDRWASGFTSFCELETRTNLFIHSLSSNYQDWDSARLKIICNQADAMEYVQNIDEMLINSGLLVSMYIFDEETQTTSPVIKYAISPYLSGFAITLYYVSISNNNLVLASKFLADSDIIHDDVIRV